MAVDENSRLEVKVILDALNAIKTAGQLETVLNSISNKKWVANISLKNIGADIDRLKSAIKSIELKKHDVNIDTSKAKDKIENLKTEFESIRKQGIRPDTKYFTSEISKLQEEIGSSEEQLRELNSIGSNFKIELTTAEALQKTLQADKKEMEMLEMVAKKTKVEFTKTALSGKTIWSNAQRGSANLVSIQKSADLSASSIKKLDDNMKQVNNDTLRTQTSAYLLASAFRNIGNVMQSVSRINPFSDILTNQVHNLAGSLNGVLSQSISGAVERYDKLKSANLTLMGLFGDGEKQTKKISNAITELDNSVLGLPTTLDDIVDSAKQYISITGDIEKGTKMAIATNRAFLASGADSEQIYHGTKQLYDLMSAGKLRTQEWESLFKAMPLSLRKVAEEMGYAGDKFGDFRDGLKTGKISAEDFMDTLIKLGYETDGSIYKLAENSKQMLSSVIINWKTALKRGIANTITTFDELSKEMTGESLTTNLIGVSKKIDDIFSDLQHYIRENKEEFAEWGELLRDFPIKEWLEGVGNYIKITAEFYKLLLKISSKAPKTISTITMFMKPLGQFTSSLLPTLIYMRAAWKSFGGLGGLFTSAPKGAKALTETAKGVSSAGKALEAGAGSILNSSFLMGEAKVGLGVAIADLVVMLTAFSAKTSASSIKGAIEELISGFEELKNFNDYTAVRRNIKKMYSITEELYALVSGKAGMEAMTDMSAGDKLLKAFNNINKAIRPLVEISSSMGEISANLNKTDISAIHFDLSMALSTISEVLDELNAPDVNNRTRTIDKSSVELLKDRIKELSSAIAYAKSISNNLTGVNWIKISDKLQNAINGMQSAISIITDPEKAEDYKGTLDISKRVNAFEQLVKSMAEATTSMKTIYTNLENLDVKELGKAKKKLKKALKGIISFTNIEELNSIISSTIQGDVGADASFAEKPTKEKVGVKQVKEKFKNFNDLLTVFTGDSGVITKLSSIVGDLESLQKINWKDAKKKLRNSITNMLDVMAVDLNDKDYDYEDIIEKSGYINDILADIQPAISNIVKINNSLQKLNENGKQVDVGSKIGDILKSISKSMSLKRLEKLQNRATQLNTFANSVFNSMTLLKTSVQGVKGKYGFDGLASSIEKCIEDLTELEKHTSIKIKVSFNPNIDTIKSRIDTIISKLNEIPTTKSVNVNVNENRNSPLFRPYIPLNKPIYKARGGLAFQPKGTDVIPAMLSRGEFVMRRSAVQMFGVDFMEKLNRMDITGALKALSTRSGAMTIHKTKTINTIHNDNRKDVKATINQYMRNGGNAPFKAGKALRRI